MEEKIEVPKEAMMEETLRTTWEATPDTNKEVQIEAKVESKVDAQYEPIVEDIVEDKNGTIYPVGATPGAMQFGILGINIGTKQEAKVSAIFGAKWTCIVAPSF